MQCNAMHGHAPYGTAGWPCAALPYHDKASSDGTCMYPYLIHRSDGHGRPALTPRTCLLVGSTNLVRRILYRSAYEKPIHAACIV